MLVYKYSDYIKEGSNVNPTIVYWNDQIDDLLDKKWTDINVKHSSGYYNVNFRCDGLDVKYNYYSVLLQPDPKEEYLMEDSTKFIEKFKIEFWNNPDKYINNMTYTPACLGDVEHVRDATNKYNV